MLSNRAISLNSGTAHARLAPVAPMKNSYSHNIELHADRQEVKSAAGGASRLRDGGRDVTASGEHATQRGVERQRPRQ